MNSSFFSKEPFVRQWGKENHLTDQTIDILIKNDVTSEEAVVPLTSNDTKRMGLSIGQANILYMAAQKLAVKSQSRIGNVKIETHYQSISTCI